MSDQRWMKLEITREKIRARTSGGAEAKADVAFDSLSVKTIQVLGKWVAETRVTNLPELQLLGWHLYAGIFSGGVEDLFHTELGKARKSKQRLLLRLHFDEEIPEWADFRWEYLFSPPTQTRKSFFLATDVDLVLARYTPLDQEMPEIPIRPQPLRVHVAAAVPGEDPGGQAEQELEASILRHTADSPPEVQVGSAVSGHFLQDIGDPPPHVFHFLGSGGTNQYGTPGVALRDGGQGLVFLAEDQLAALVHRQGWHPSLVVLQLWELGAVAGGRDWLALSSIARRLIQEGIPAVVAMQYPLGSVAAREFSGWFYHELSQGEAVDHAVQSARWKVSLIDQPVESPGFEHLFFGTPMLYTNSYGALVEPPEERAERLAVHSSRPARNPVAERTEAPASEMSPKVPAPPIAGTPVSTPQRRRTDPATTRLYRAGKEKATELRVAHAAYTDELLAELDARAGAERIEWLLTRLAEPERYEHEREVLLAVAEAAVLYQIDVRWAAFTNDLSDGTPSLRALIVTGAEYVARVDLDAYDAADLMGLLTALLVALAPRGVEDRLALLRQEAAAVDGDEVRRVLVVSLIRAAGGSAD